MVLLSVKWLVLWLPGLPISYLPIISEFAYTTARVIICNPSTKMKRIPVLFFNVDNPC